VAQRDASNRGVDGVGEAASLGDYDAPYGGAMSRDVAKLLALI
jgi:hypothetical protein